MIMVNGDAQWMPGHWVSNAIVVEGALIEETASEVINQVRESGGMPSDDEREALVGFARQIHAIFIVDLAISNMMMDCPTDGN